MSEMIDVQALPAGATVQEDGSVHYVLLRQVTLPATNGGTEKRLAELTFHEPTAGDLIDAGVNGAGANSGLSLLASLTGNKGPVGEKLLRAMSARDYLASQKIIAAFFSDGQTTGQ